MKYPRSLTKVFDVVQNAGDGDSSLKNHAISKSHLEFFELELILFDLAINVKRNIIF